MEKNSNKPMVKWVSVDKSILTEKDKKIGQISVSNIKFALNDLNDVIAEELKYNKASDINFELVDKLRDIKDRIKENL